MASRVVQPTRAFDPFSSGHCCWLVGATTNREEEIFTAATTTTTTTTTVVCRRGLLVLSPLTRCLPFTGFQQSRWIVDGSPAGSFVTGDPLVGYEAGHSVLRPFFSLPGDNVSPSPGVLTFRCRRWITDDANRVRSTV